MGIQNHKLTQYSKAPFYFRFYPMRNAIIFFVKTNRAGTRVRAGTRDRSRTRA